MKLIIKQHSSRSSNGCTWSRGCNYVCSRHSERKKKVAFDSLVVRLFMGDRQEEYLKKF